MNSFFTDDLDTSNEGAEVLKKALSAGYGTDSANYINGRAMIVEDLENSVVNVLHTSQRDWKLLSLMKKTPMHSTVHEVIRRTDEGDYEFLATGEGEPSHVSSQELKRLIVTAKNIQTLRGVTKQMELARTFEDAYTSEKLAGINTVLRALEHMAWQGNSEINDKEFDGFVTILKKSAISDDGKPAKTASIDFRGDKLTDRGETALNEIARLVYERGGFIDRAFFPPAIAEQFYELFRDRVRFMEGTTTGGLPAMREYSTSIGSVIKYNGADAGADKFFKARGEVSAAGDESKRPNAPTVTAALLGKTNSTTNNFDADKVVGSQFTSADEGFYAYRVHAMNQYGRSAGSSVVIVDKKVVAGGGVGLTITPDASGKTATGFIITRSKSPASTSDDATKTNTYEMVSISANSKAGKNNEYTYIDKNADLPGTADIIFLPEQNGLVTYYDLGQLMPVSAIPMYPKDALVTPFVVGTFASLIVRAPEFCGIIKNVGL